MTFFFSNTNNNNAATASDATRAALGLGRWRDAIAVCDDADTREAAEAILVDAESLALLEAVFGSSPYLTQSLVSDLKFSCVLFREGPESVMKQVLKSVA
jgi:glutamate-ammonia-ligase adenylyltransferase